MSCYVTPIIRTLFLFNIQNNTQQNDYKHSMKGWMKLIRKSPSMGSFKLSVKKFIIFDTY